MRFSANRFVVPASLVILGRGSFVHATVIYTSQGFELAGGYGPTGSPGYAKGENTDPADLWGQSTPYWGPDQYPLSYGGHGVEADVETSVTDGGTQAISLTRLFNSVDTRWAPTAFTSNNYQPLASGTPIIDVDWDMDVASGGSNSVFGIELDQGHGANSQLAYAGIDSVGNFIDDHGSYITGPGGTVSLNSWHHYQLQANFTTQTYEVFIDDSTTPADTFSFQTLGTNVLSDAALVSFSETGGAATGTAYYDNYVINAVTAGTRVITNTATYSGTTVVNTGTLDIQGALANSGTITVDATSASANLILDGANAVPATAAITGTGTFGPTITVNANQTIGSINSVGSTTFQNGSTSTVGPIDGSGTLNVSGTSNLTAGHIRQGILNIDTTSIVTIADSPNPGTTTATSILTDLNNSGTLDLKNNDLIITDTTQFSAVQSAITNAYNGGLWNQPGITSSSAAAHPNSYGLGYATAGAVHLSTFDGQSVSSGTVLVKYTLLGDALLTGTVGLGDYNAVVANLNTGTLWSQGAFHPGSTTGLADYNAVIANFNATASGSAAIGPALKTAASPSLKTAALSFSPNAATDLKLEVNTVTGDVYALATATTALTGYDIFDKSGNLLDSGDPNTDLNERLLSQPSSTTLGNQTTFRNGTNYKLWATILDNGSTLAEGQNNGKLKQGTASTYDTINIPAAGTIDFGDIYNTVVKNNDITFAFSEADPTNAGNPVTGSTYNGEVDYVGNTVMPEPGTLGLLGMGGIMMMRRRRKPR